MPPKVLVLMNAARESEAPGQVDAFRQLANNGEIADATFAYLKTDNDPDQPWNNSVATLRSKAHDVVVAMTPGFFPSSVSKFDILEEALGPRMLLYWEGDAWGKRKSVTPIMRRWLGRADIVFSVAGEPQASMFLHVGARRVHHILHTYCHVRWSHQELEPPPSRTDLDVAMIANLSGRVPIATGLPGSARRLELGCRIRARRQVGGSVFGEGWPPGLAVGSLPFDQQVQAIRRAKVSVNWDQYPGYFDYSSNRLPISLLAGRPHVTTRHPGMAWAPGPDLGLFQEESPSQVVERLDELLSMDPAKRHRLGCEAHRWVARRVSSREAARHLLSAVVPTVKPPPADPWGLLPGPWVRN